MSAPPYYVVGADNKAETDLKAPVGQPAADEDGDDDGDKTRDWTPSGRPLLLTPGCDGVDVTSRRPQSRHQQRVEHAHAAHRK